MFNKSIRSTRTLNCGNLTTIKGQGYKSGLFSRGRQEERAQISRVFAENKEIE